MQITIVLAPGTPNTGEMYAAVLREAANSVAKIPALVPPLIVSIRAKNGLLLGAMTFEPEPPPP
jgi:hypothetical protein